MANECSFSALITGRTANVREFLKTMRKNWAYEVICEDEPELEDFAPDYKILPSITLRQSLDELIAEWDHDKLVNRLEAGRAKAKVEREELATLQRFKPSRHLNKNPYLFL